MRLRQKRKKRIYNKNIIGKNCKFISYLNGIAICKLSNNDPCNKTNTCGYEEESRTINRLKNILK
jgi:hypothetical protein